MIPFTPAATVTVPVTTVTSRVALPTPKKNQVLVTNAAGGSLAFIKFGDLNVTAAITDTPILPGTAYIFTIAPGVTHIAAITGTSTATVYATLGEGA